MRRRYLMPFIVILVLLCFGATALAARILVKEGSRGHAVVTVQQLLIEQGYLKDKADGIAGPKTVAAIKAFQKARGLKVDGICGEATFAELSGGVEYEPPAEPEQEKAPGKGRGKPAPPVFEAAEEKLLMEKVASRDCRKLFVEATAYSAMDPGNKPTTSTGEFLRRGIIAVDPAVIPLGSKVYIPGYGLALAADVGSGIKGHFIDVAFDTREEALKFGRCSFEIYVIE